MGGAWAGRAECMCCSELMRPPMCVCHPQELCNLFVNYLGNVSERGMLLLLPTLDLILTTAPQVGWCAWWFKTACMQAMRGQAMCMWEKAPAAMHDGLPASLCSRLYSIVPPGHPLAALPLATRLSCTIPVHVALQAAPQALQPALLKLLALTLEGQVGPGLNIVFVGWRG